MVEYFALALYLNIVLISFYLIKMRVLTYASFKEHYDLYNEIHGSITVNSCQVRLAQKDIILLSRPPILTYKAGTAIGVENRNLIHSSIPAGTYSIDDFNTKIKNLSYNKDKTGNHPKLKT